MYLYVYTHINCTYILTSYEKKAFLLLTDRKRNSYMCMEVNTLPWSTG